MKEPKVNLSIVDQFDPETSAMLQSFYSRSHQPIQQRIAEMGEDIVSVKESLKQYYIGYGHASIGQCGATTIFLEGVSILAAKVIQDTRLYNGQESSTRFINFAEQPIHNPAKDQTGIQQKWIDFYNDNQDEVVAHVAAKFHLDVNDPVHYKTAKARAFDILRGFIPAGCATQLSWFTDFNHASTRLVQLAYHPLEEVRAIARELAKALEERYPYAFADFDKKLKRFADYYSSNSMDLNYLTISQNEAQYWPDFETKQTYMSSSTRTQSGLRRIPGVPVPRHTQYSGRFQFRYLLDYGAFRDIQRHRDCVQMMPIVTTDFGFHQWYIDSLPEPLQKKAKILIYNQIVSLNALKRTTSDVNLQYYIPMGFKVPCMLDCDFPQLVYISELRSNRTVHPTLRNIAKRMARVASSFKVTDVFVDESPDDAITIKRGSQDITKK